jgi:hypothetical protein
MMDGIGELPNPLAIQQCLDHDGDFSVKEWDAFKKSDPTQSDIVGGRRTRKSRKVRKRKIKSIKSKRQKSKKKKSRK